MRYNVLCRLLRSLRKSSGPIIVLALAFVVLRVSVAIEPREFAISITFIVVHLALNCQIFGLKKE